MTKFNIICADCPWNFSDKLTMSGVKRGAKSNYQVMSDNDIISLDVKSIAADDCILALWIPSSKIDVGMKCLELWGNFKCKQTWIWIKTKKNPLTNLTKQIFKNIRKITDFKSFKKQTVEIINSFNINEILSFYMGHYFRQTHEVVLIGVRGKMASKIKNKSQRSVFLGPIGKHSEKPEALQDMLDKMFDGKKVEMFSRRNRTGWLTVGNECPGAYLGEDIRDSIERLKNE